MAGYSEKSRRYLRWAATNERRANSTRSEDFRRMLLNVAAQYRELAREVDNPETVKRNGTGRLRANIG